MKFSPRIMSDRNILDRYQDTFNRIVEWYQEVYQNNSKSLTEEYINVMTEMILLPDSTLYNDINAKQSLFQIAEILEKILLAKYSYSPKDCKSISSSVEKTWLDVSWDFIMLTDTLQTELMREKEGANIALRVLLYERGQVRNPIVHRGSKAICLSAVRCYNVIRSMLIFIEPSLRSSLQEYRYPEEEDCVQSLFSHTGNFGFKIKTSILFVDTLRDMPLEYRELISRLPWNLVVDLDGYSDFEGAAASFSGNGNIYHMHAEAMRLVLKNELQHAEDEEQDCDYSKFEKRIDAIMKFYSLSAQYGSPDRAWVSELILLVEYLGFIYKKKKRLADKAYPDLSEKQNYYRMTIHRLINMISQLDLDESTQNLANRYISRFKVELMSNGYKDARTYYENKIASLRNNSGSETELITAQNGLLSVYFGIYEEEKNAKLISVILGLISDMLEVNHNEDEYFECCNRCALYQKWMKFAKLANKPVDDGIIIADRWRQLVEKNTFNIDIRPYYYLYVLYFLSALEGNSLRMNDANKYRKICGEKWISKLGAIDRIRDFFVIGKGMGQLHEAGSYQNHADVLQNRQVKLATFSGRFDDITSKKGHIHITEPGEWNRIIAKFNLNNTLGITNNQLSHQLSFLGGFSYETIVALDKTVKDMSIQASKSSSTAAPQFRQFEVNFKVDRFSDIDGYVLEGSFLDKSGNEKLAILKAEQIERYSVKEIAVYGDIKDIFLSLEKRTKEIKAMTIGHSHGYIELSVIDFYEHLCDLMEVE